jgi:hypothetical protein
VGNDLFVTKQISTLKTSTKYPFFNLNIHLTGHANCFCPLANKYSLELSKSDFIRKPQTLLCGKKERDEIYQSSFPPGFLIRLLYRSTQTSAAI